MNCMTPENTHTHTHTHTPMLSSLINLIKTRRQESFRSSVYVLRLSLWKKGPEIELEEENVAKEATGRGKREELGTLCCS